MIIYDEPVMAAGLCEGTSEFCSCVSSVCGNLPSVTFMPTTMVCGECKNGLIFIAGGSCYVDECVGFCDQEFPQIPVCQVGECTQPGCSDENKLLARNIMKWRLYYK